MDTFVLKITLSPLLILAASLAGRRWGEAVGGWFVGMPWTTGQVVLFLGLDHGPGFAVQAALGALGGTAVEAAFCLAYGGAARHGWPAAIAAATLAFAVGAVAVAKLPKPLWALLPVALVTLLWALWLVRPRDRRIVVSARPAPPHWDLPARMLTAAMLVLALTRAAPLIGPAAAGVTASYPVFAAVLTVFAHRANGAAAAVNVLRGLLLGLFGFAGFFLVLALMLPRSGIAAAFAGAALAAVAIQGVSLAVIRRRFRGSASA